MYIDREWKDFFFLRLFLFKILRWKILKRLHFSTPRQSSRVLTLIQRRLCLKNDSVSRCWCDISEATRMFLTTQYFKIPFTCPSRHVAPSPRHREAAGRYPGWFRCRHLSRWIFPLGISTKKREPSHAAARTGWNKTSPSALLLQLISEEGGAHQMYFRSATQSAVC